MRPTKLRCEYLENPIGIDIVRPRLFWIYDLNKDVYDSRQTAYQIHAASTLNQLKEGDLVWDSRKVMSTDSTHIIYEGANLKSRKRIYWRVRVWDESQEVGEWSESAYFELGLLKSSDWKAKWINPEKSVDINVQQPASYIRKEFVLDEEVVNARLYITSCGVYESWLNGKRIGNQLFTPGVTSYEKRLQIQTYDVTSHLSQGANVLGAILGDGWYRGRLGNEGNRNVYGKNVLLLAQLEIKFLSGKKQLVYTDGTWKATQDGPIRYSDLQDGELYDGRMALTNWSQSDFVAEKWHSVTESPLNDINLIGANSVPIGEHEHFSAKVLHTPDGNTVLDFGQNIAGYVQFKVRGNKGDKVTLVHGEALDKNGNFTIAHLNNTSRSKKNPLKQEITYYLSGNGVETYKPHFTIHGFRYVLIKNWTGKVNASNFVAIAVYSNLSLTGEFECSNQLINQLVSNTLWSQKSNFLDIPTDCPQRERAAWTGDAQVFVRTGSTLMDTAAFYRKWMKDVAIQQKKNGMIRNIAPRISDGSNRMMEMIEGSAGWGDAAVIIPWTIYRVFGDKQILEEQWDSMKAWVEYEARCARKTHWSRLFKKNPYRKYTWDTKFHWGEWTEPPSNDYPKDNMVKNALFSVPEVATAYFSYSSHLLAKSACILGYQRDAIKYKKQSENVKEAYIYNFTDNGEIDSSRQCLYVRPLAFSLLPKSKARKAANKLNSLIVDNGYHIGTGFLSTPYICQILCEYDYTDTAYKLIEQTTMPSWLYPITKGATTIWEHWDGVNEDNDVRESLNHYSSGAIVEWLFQCVSGIDLYKDSVGYKHFLIAPKPGGTLTFAKCTYQSINGKIVSAWEIDSDCFKLKVQIPPNTKAKVKIPYSDKSRVKVLKGKMNNLVFMQEQSCISTNLPSGEYEFSYTFKDLH